MTRVIREPRRDPRTGTDLAGATPVGSALVARAVLRVRLRQVIGEACVARAVAAALARKAGRPGAGSDR